MEKHFDVLRQTRQNLLDFAANFTIEELNFIPPNFNNNILWNAAHLIATQQVLYYKLSGLDLNIYLDFVDRYRKGTKPEKFVGEEEWQFVKEQLIKTIAPSIEDYNQKRFQNFKKYETSYGIILENINDAIIFNNVHEGLHFGYIKALGRIIKKS